MIEDMSVHYRRILFFVALTYAISWGLWGAGAAFGAASTGWMVLSTLAGFGPAIAGGALSWRSGRLREWASPAVRWRVGVQWWIIALLGAPALSVLGYGLYVAATGAAADVVGGPLLYTMLFVYVLLLRGGVGEELGWRGYALPGLLERHATLTAALVVGVIWAGWHLPLFLIQGTRQTRSFAIYLVGVVGLSILLAWLYVRGERSVLLAAVFHAGWNVVDSGAVIAVTGDGLFAPAASAIVVWGAAIVLIVADGETMRASPG